MTYFAAEIYQLCGAETDEEAARICELFIHGISEQQARDLAIQAVLQLRTTQRNYFELLNREFVD